MGLWNDRIRNHAVWETLKQLGPAIDQAASKEGIDAASIDSLERMRAVLSFTGKRLAAADPFLSDLRPFNNLNVALTAAIAGVQTFTSDGNSAHLTAANAQADEVLANLPLVQAPASNDDLTTIGESLSAYRTALEKHLAAALAAHKVVKTQSDANVASLATLTAEIAAEKQKVATLATDFQTQFIADQTARAAEHTAAQTERQTGYSAKLTEHQAAFTAAQAERQEKYTTTATENQTQLTAAEQARAKEHAAAHQDRQEKFGALMIDYTKKLGDQNALFVEQREKAMKDSADALRELTEKHDVAAQKILDAIEVKRSAVEKLVGVIGNLGVTSGYLTTANHARTAMYVWQVLTVVSLGALIFFAYQIALGRPADDPTRFYQGLATRIFLSITVGIFAAYAARQADKASIAERRNRKLALELEAVGPYIADLPTDMQNKFRIDLGDRSFGVPEVDGKGGENSPSPATLIDLLKSKEGKDLVAEVVKVVQAAK